MMAESVTNETLAAMLLAQEKHGNERHLENVKRLERIEVQTRETNGRLQKVERRQAVDLQRLQSLDKELARKADRVLRPRREIVVKVGLASAGGIGLLLLQELWKALHG